MEAEEIEAGLESDESLCLSGSFLGSKPLCWLWLLGAGYRAFDPHVPTKDDKQNSRL